MKRIKGATGGLFVSLIGLVFLLGARGLTIGAPLNMGPGMFPVVLSCLTIVTGLTIAANDILRGMPVLPRLDLKAVAGVSIAIAVYALLIERAGILVTTCLAIGILGSIIPRMSWKETGLLALGLSLFLWLVFGMGLGMPLKLFPEGLT
jgi:putative tricarboxylic transport membrane protein